jgi:hypothetical protein
MLEKKEKNFKMGEGDRPYIGIVGGPCPGCYKSHDGHELITWLGCLPVTFSCELGSGPMDRHHDAFQPRSTAF